MRELLATGLSRLNFGRPLIGLDNRRGPARRRTENDLVGVGHTTADDNGTNQSADDHQATAAAPRFLVLVIRIVVIVVVLLACDRQGFTVLVIISGLVMLAAHTTAVSVRILPLLLVAVRRRSLIAVISVSRTAGRHIAAEVVIAGVLRLLLRPLIILRGTQLIAQARLRLLRRLSRLACCIELSETRILERLRPARVAGSIHRRLVMRTLLGCRPLLMGLQILIELRERIARWGLCLRSRTLLAEKRRLLRSRRGLPAALVRKMIGLVLIFRLLLWISVRSALLISIPRLLRTKRRPLIGLMSSGICWLRRLGLRMLLPMLLRLRTPASHRTVP